VTAEPFLVDVPEETLSDLRDRLGRTRLPRGFADDGWTYGTNMDYLAELLAYWRDGYDWRAHEAEINQLDHFKVPIDEVPIHFVLAKGKGPRPLPLLLNHGWPWTFWDYRDVIGPLSDPAAYGGDPADAFDVVVPSLPGFVFSTPVPRPGVDWQVTADLFAELMTGVLGYERFGVFGGDWGRAITLQMGHRYGERIAGVHVCGTHRMDAWNSERPWDIFGPVPEGVSPEVREIILSRQRKFATHVCVHVLDPLTLAAGLHDSPAGLAAWLLERRRTWSDCDGDVEQRFSKDVLLTHFTLYWVTDCFATTARYYLDAAARPWVPDHERRPMVEVPTGVTVFRRDDQLARTEEQTRQEWNVQFRREHERGGHFAPAEEPEAVVGDIRDFFRPLR